MLYIIHSGTGSTNCQIPSAPQDFQLLPSTFQVSGCDTMKLNVVGGTEPYTMVIVGENDVTNFTIPNSNTTLNYVNVQETGSIFLGESFTLSPKNYADKRT